MPALLLYLLKLSCSLGILWLFYRLVLRSLTFYNWNRWYLLGYSFLCFLIPFIDIGPIDKEDPALQPVVIQYIPVIDKSAPIVAAPVAHSATFDPWNYLLAAFALGSAFLLLRLLWRWFSLRRLRQHAVLMQEGPVKIFHISAPVSPFSFGNAIYVNTNQHTAKEWEEIILHEYVHIRQRHTLDILFGELLIIVNWYNPFAWLIRYSIRQNLEFIADRAVVEAGRDKKGYQYHLLKVVGQTRYRIANNFNFSSLKKRIIMMNKMKSTRLHLLRFLFILPLLAILLIAFRDRLPAFHSGKDLFVNVAGIAIRTPGRTPEAGVTVKEFFTGIQTTTDNRGFYKLRIPVKNGTVRVRILFEKTGYDGPLYDKTWHSVNESKGLCEVGFMRLQSDTGNGSYSLRPTKEPPVDPSYADAVRRLDDIQVFDPVARVRQSMQKFHPEISLWYICPGAKQWVLVRTDGTVERYGYSGTPPVTALSDKYGADYFLIPGNMPPVTSNYLSRWAAISAQAEKEFHTTTQGVRSILFPGDSRVIVIPISGKPRVYDMDSDDPKERPAFELLYGRLPACVPEPLSHPAPATTPRDSNSIASRSIASRSTASRSTAHKPDTTKPAKLNFGWTNPDFHKALWIVDGVVKPKGWYDLDSIKSLNVAGMNIYSGAEARRVFGAKGKHGVVYVVTKAPQPNIPTFVTHPSNTTAEQPIYIVDGRLLTYNVLDSLNPGDISSITVLKEEAAKAIYGSKGANGVIMITTKKGVGYTPK